MYVCSSYELQTWYLKEKKLSQDTLPLKMYIFICYLIIYRKSGLINKSEKTRNRDIGSKGKAKLHLLTKAINHHIYHPIPSTDILAKVKFQKSSIL